MTSAHNSAHTSTSTSLSPRANTSIPSLEVMQDHLLAYFAGLWQRLSQETDHPLASWKSSLQEALKQRIRAVNHGDLPGWLEAVNSLPELEADIRRLDTGCIQLNGPCDELKRQQLEQNLRALMPWRKGPYELFDIHIDTEWRSDFKWDRLQGHISDLHNRRVLDIGCGNGYHCWRMYAAGAREVLGIDPSWKFLLQFQALKKYIGDLPVELLPLGIEHLPRPMPAFDTVFSMGVFYHRRSPIDHLLELKDFLRPAGELVLETLVIEGDDTAVLVPADRYARMRNVWFLPSCGALANWLQRAGFDNVRCVDVNRTQTTEQRATDWMRYHSLADFLDPADSSRTVEGHPAPLRAVLVARKPF